MFQRQGPDDRLRFQEDRGPRRRGPGLGMPVHPHMLRHAAGFAPGRGGKGGRRSGTWPPGGPLFANDGQDTRAIQLYLGHRNIQHTVGYTQLSPQRFNEFWED